MNNIAHFFWGMKNGRLVDADWSPVWSDLICWKGNIGVFYDDRMVRRLDTNEVPSEEEVLSVFGMDSETLCDRAFYMRAKGLYYENGRVRGYSVDYEDENDDEEDEESFSDVPSDDDEWDKLPKFASFAHR